MRHRVLDDIHKKILKYPVGLLTVQPQNELLFRIAAAEFQARLFNLIFQFELDLLEQVDDIYIDQIQRHILAARLAYLEQVFNEHLQPVRLLLQHLDIGLALIFVLLFLQKVHISDDRSQRGLEIM